MKFNTEHPLFQFLARVFDLVFLNALWLFMCTPVITAGAATSALFTITMKMAGNEEGYIVRGFFRAFRDNFVQSTILWLIALLSGAVIGIDIWFFVRTETSLGKVLFILVAVVLFFYILTLLFLFPLQAKFRNRTPEILKNAFLISVSNIPYSLLLLLIVILTLTGLYVFPWIGSFIFSLYAFGTSFIFNKIFDKYIHKSGADELPDKSYDPDVT